MAHATNDMQVHTEDVKEILKSIKKNVVRQNWEIRTLPRITMNFLTRLCEELFSRN